MQDIEKGYMGNVNLKRAGAQIEFTKEMVEEFIKCSEDPVYFAETYFKIVNVDQGLITIPLYDYQQEIIETVKNERYTVAECARQSGKTTAITVVVLWHIIFNKNYKVLILANKGDVAQEVLDRIQLAYEHLPTWLKHGVTTWNKRSFVLENGSKVTASNTSKKAGRSGSINLLIIDEAAHVENWDEFYTSVYPVITSGKSTKVVLISTVYGLNHFYNITSLAREGKNDFKLISIPWYRVPGRDETWKQETLAGMNFDMERFAQEFENKYLGSSGSLIAGWKLEILKPQIPLMEKDGFTQFVKPEKNRRYCLVADVARGRGLDYSAFSVIDVTNMPYNQVAIFRDNLITPTDYAQTIYEVAKMYNEALVLVEINDIGQQVADIVYDDYTYENIIFTENAGVKGKRVSLGFGKPAEKGIRTTKTVKNIGCAIVKMLVEQDQLIVNDKNTIFEFATFSRKNNSYEAEPGKHDDMVMGLVLFAWLTDQTYFKEYTDINTLMKLREKTEQEIMENMLPFGFIEDGVADVMADDERNEYVQTLTNF